MLLDLLRRLRVAPRLALAFGLVVVVMSAASTIGIWRLQQLQGIADELGGPSTQRAVLARELHGIVLLSSTRAETLLQTDDPALAERINADRKLTSTRSEAVRKQLDGLVDDERTRELFAVIDRNGSAFRQARDGLVKRKAGVEKIGTELVSTQLRPAADAYARAVQDLAHYQAERVESDRARARASAREGLAMLVGGITIGLLLSVGLGWVLARSIVAPLRDASAVAGQVAAGQLSTAAHAPQGSDELEVLMTDLSGMQDKLARLVSSVQSVTESITTATNEIADGNRDLSSRTEHVASNLQQTASSVEELATAVRHSAASAQQASQLAQAASQAASRGGEVVGQVVQTMESIAKSSHRIEEIIGVIDGIAFQTNILALNAAVEAARAGEQGRGFAVVAGEVRALAQRSAQAAREIKSLIVESVGQVGNGAALVEQAGSAMSEIVSGVRRVTEVIGEISDAAAQQSQGIDSVNGSVADVDQVMQQNAALAEQSTAATESLRGQTERLAQAVRHFRLS